MNTATELSSRAREGDRRALEALLAKTEPDLRRIAQRLCRAEDADDALQDAMLQASVNIRAFRAAAKFTSWMFSIIRNECARYLRRAARWTSLAVEPQGHGDPEQRARDRELVHHLSTCTANLPDELRRVFVMRELEGRSTRDVASVLALSEGNVKVRLHRARRHLRDALSQLV